MEKLVAANTFVFFQRNGDFYTFSNSYDNTVLATKTQEISTEEVLLSAVNFEECIAGNISNSNAKNDNFGAEVIIKELNFLRGFQAKKKRAFFTGKSKNENNVSNNADLVISLLESRITSFQSELSKKDGIIEFLSQQLVLCREKKSRNSNDSDTESITRVFFQEIQLNRMMTKAHYKKRKRLKILFLME